MRGVQNSYLHFYTFSFLLVFFHVFILFRPAYPIHLDTFSSTNSLTITSNKTIVSPGAVFELGFFKTTSSSRWYLGIWYKKITERTYVWVANRDKPLSNPSGSFKILDVLLDHSDNIVWSTNLTKRYVRSPVVAELLANGNFVMRYSNNNSKQSGFLWQSFDYPTDTLLPEMKLGIDRKTGFNRFLKSWRSPDDPASGDFTYKIETLGSPEFFLRMKDFALYRSGPWFSDVPEMLNYMVSNFTENKEEIAYSFRMTNDNIYPRLTMSPLGQFQLFMWNPTSREWNLFWDLPKDQCDLYKICGRYSYCDANTSVCNCISGFKLKDPRAWESKDVSQECVRKTRLSCGGDGFLQLKKMKLPENTTAIVDNLVGIKECLKRRTNDCSCTAFANADIRNGGSGCVIWKGELADIILRERRSRALRQNSWS